MLLFMNKEILVQKAPAVKIGVLAEALLNLNSKSKIRNIGVRHGEKLSETLITREEVLLLLIWVNFIKFLLIRDLNYDNYFTTGN